MWIIVLQRIGFEFLWHILFFPIWWYTFGAKEAGKVCLNVFLSGNDSLAPFLWLRNLFVPMYGQYDWQGRIMSFFIRLVNIIVRAALLLVWAIIALTLFVAWLVSPMFVVYMLIQSL